MKWLIAFLLLAFPMIGNADEISICYNYGCNVTAKVAVTENQLDQVQQLFQGVRNAAGERAAVSRAIGLLETFSGMQTPTWRDKGGNSEDDGVDGRMDCIDHSHNSTQYLKLIESHGWLKFHRVLEAVKRAPLLVNVHWAAQIEEISNHHHFVVDSWFFDNGKPAMVLDLNAWEDGAGPS